LLAVALDMQAVVLFGELVVEAEAALAQIVALDVGIEPPAPGASGFLPTLAGGGGVIAFPAHGNVAAGVPGVPIRLCSVLPGGLSRRWLELRRF